MELSTAGCIRQSVKIIKHNQAQTGAYLASPAFVHYRYAWLRDGTFVAYAMDRVGEHDSARRFYEWCSGVLLKHEQKARRAIAAVRSGEVSTDWDGLFLHTRYTVDGEEVEGEWGNFQLDGYGTWLWGLAEHIRMTGDVELIDRFRSAIELTLEYLQACWQLPNYDCWEEFGDRIHPATLAAIYGGCKSIARWLPERKGQLSVLCGLIETFVRENGTENGRFVKSLGNPAVDASLLWLSLPFGLAALDEPTMEETVRQMEQEIVRGRGVHRYPEDVYYGGGQWILLSAWLGWYYAQTGRTDEAGDILCWIESKWTEEGLPEQVQDHLLAPKAYGEWVERAGQPALPLLWSHAMYLVLAAELGLVDSIEKENGAPQR
ncbi:glycoside hydrolase family 15 protein [Brevibacillus sp. H7]|uniref:glycoside hydrolase family 15 protein n=1 Tax=Brevibacillus sp. H7 TaxID=3349138 RepID=UPI0037F7E476